VPPDGRYRDVHGMSDSSGCPVAPDRSFAVPAVHGVRGGVDGLGLDGRQCVCIRGPGLGLPHPSSVLEGGYLVGTGGLRVRSDRRVLCVGFDGEVRLSGRMVAVPLQRPLSPRGDHVHRAGPFNAAPCRRVATRLGPEASLRSA